MKTLYALPAKASDQVARFLAPLASGSSVRERIEGGRERYAELRKMIIAEQKIVMAERTAKGKPKTYVRISQ